MTKDNIKEIKNILDIKLKNNEPKLIPIIISYLDQCECCEEYVAHDDYSNYLKTGCDGDFKSNYYKICDECQDNVVCGECGEADIDEEHDIQQCSHCHSNICNQCSYTDCIDCNRRYCKDCIGIYFCYDCEESACKRCRSFIKLPNGDYIYCSDCYKVC